MQKTIQYLPMVFLGGGLGASLRFFLTIMMNHFTKRLWAGTLTVNVLGCLIMFLGIKFASFHVKEFNYFMKIGFLGSLTTFSAFSFEIVDLLKTGRFGEAIAVFLLNIFFGIFIGIWVLR